METLHRFSLPFIVEKNVPNIRPFHTMKNLRVEHGSDPCWNDWPFHTTTFQHGSDPCRALDPCWNQPCSGGGLRVLDPCWKFQHVLKAVVWTSPGWVRPVLGDGRVRMRSSATLDIVLCNEQTCQILLLHARTYIYTSVVAWGIKPHMQRLRCLELS